ncbi:uncharacterized protein TNIN_427961 [Trichonephila inaurata madagascariensis]|uniref:Uncharacterized protein n=1 Tax=Trichonephila inaurata madagascariensis TaxID=2747483 RepID=A0A8X6WSJ7_9ARAC|nr:uncharacterized protein TNIN_427961 [Trichonephila inaurata madagascariensis]
MEGKYLVESKEITGNVSAYGTVNPSFESVDHGSSVKEKHLSGSAPCSCPSSRNCDCSLGNKKVFFEPWARYKTITMAVGLSLFGIWVIGIAIVAKQGKL